MYSVVLMAALTTGNAAPNWHRCGGGCGSYGGSVGGCYGGGYGSGYDGYGCYGCWGGYSNWSYGCASNPAAAAPGGYGLMSGAAMPATGIGGEQLGKPKPDKNGNTETMAPTRAQFVVELPSNASLFIDDVPVKATAGVHRFNTPALKPGQAYFYLVRIERMREGGPVSETRLIMVQAGQVARADFREPESEAVRTAQVK